MGLNSYKLVHFDIDENMIKALTDGRNCPYVLVCGTKRLIKREKLQACLKKQYSIKAIPHNSARADPEKIWVLIKALFRRCTLCTSRKSDEIRAQIFQEMPKADCAVLP